MLEHLHECPGMLLNKTMPQENDRLELDRLGRSPISYSLTFRGNIVVDGAYQISLIVAIVC